MNSMQVKDKLKNIAVKRNLDFNTLLRLYMYDRFIERLRDDAVTVGIAFDLQIFPEVPKEPHDAQLDYIITETRILTPNK